MRTFYIFNINKNFYELMKTNPLHLYRTMEDIHNFSKDDLSVACDLFYQIINPFNVNQVNNKIFLGSQDNDFYTKHRNIHKIINKYKPEDTNLRVNQTFLVLESNILKPYFLDILKDYNNLFVCDFKNKDYFWLNEYACL